MKNGESKVENANTSALKPAGRFAGLRRSFSAPKFLTILLGLLAFVSPAIAAEIVTESPAVDPGTHLIWMAKWFLLLPIVVLIGYSLIVNKRQGWGWVIVGMAIVFVLMIAQLIWSVITSMSGDAAADEDYFTPIKNWTSDSFDD